jgi:DNA-binding HxlR family transcriptional regulator
MTTVDTNCRTYRLAIEILARPWTAVILNLLQEGPLRFSEIGERIPGLGDKVLSSRLKELEARGLIVRSVDPGPPVRVGYSLTPQGCGFNDVAHAIERWGRELVTIEDKGPA